MFKPSTLILAAVAIFGTAQFANAQGFYQETHFHNVPHTTTHLDYVRHGNHIDAVPHTTTYIDAVPHTTTHVHGGHHWAAIRERQMMQ